MAKKTKRTEQGTWWGIPAEPERPSLMREDTLFDGNPVRIVYVKGEPWWVLADVARVLEYRDAEQAKRLLRDKHRGTTLNGTPGIPAGMLTVNEPGLYRLMMRSDKPASERFQDWICEEVIPAIRKHGCYTMPMSRVSKIAKRNRCSLETALARGENTDTNKNLHSCLARYKAKRPHYRAVHNRLAEAQFGEGLDVPSQRKALGLRSWQTPLDRYEEIPVTINSLIKQVGLRALQAEADAGRPVPVDDIPAFLATIGRRIARANLNEIGPETAFGVREDDDLGRVYDVIQKQIGAQN